MQQNSDTSHTKKYTLFPQKTRQHEIKVRKGLCYFFFPPSSAFKTHLRFRNIYIHPPKKHNSPVIHHGEILGEHALDVLLATAE